MEQELKIVYRDYGIADRFDDGTIELNRNLDKYPELKRAIIQHEIKHTNNPRFNKQDLLHDLSTQDQVRTWHMIQFIFKNPKAFMQFVPLYYTKERGWIKDNNLIVIWSFFLLISLVGIYFGIVI